MSSPLKTLEKSVKIIEVYEENVYSEFQRIGNSLSRYPFISMDTEFPGVIFKNYNHRKQTPAEYYEILKKNVDALKLIQVGLTLSDSHGNLPEFDTHTCIWQFNLSDFDVSKDSYAPDSVQLLKDRGIDFERNRREGIESKVFAEFPLYYGVVYDREFALYSQQIFYDYPVSWMTFHSGYDFGYLIKLQMYPLPLPTRIEEFLWLVNQFFGSSVYDIKHMMKYCEGLHGGLERVGKALGVEREVGNCHQAGSDSLLTMKTFLKMYQKFFSRQNIQLTYGGALHDLTIDEPSKRNYGVVMPSHQLNIYPFHCQLYRNQFPAYSNLIN